MKKTAALLTSPSSLPKCSTACATPSVQSASELTSRWTKNAFSPSSPTTFFASSSRMSAATTRAPSATSRRAVCSPVPLAAPVTRTTLPSTLPLRSLDPMLSHPFCHVRRQGRPGGTPDVPGEGTMPNPAGAWGEARGPSQTLLGVRRSNPPRRCQRKRTPSITVTAWPPRRTVGLSPLLATLSRRTALRWTSRPCSAA